MNNSLLMTRPHPLGDTKLDIRRKTMLVGETRLHWHDYYEMEIIVSGKALHCLNGQEYELSRGNMYILSYFDYHSVKALENTEIININFSPELLDGRISEYMKKSGKAVMCRLDEEQTEYMDGRISVLEKINKSAQSPDDLVLRAVLAEITAIVLKNSDEPEREAMPDFVQKAIGYIHENFRRDISLNILADKLSVSPGYLGKLLKGNLGKTFNEYLGDVRLKYACNLLESNNLSVGEIAINSGHNSVQYFLHVFKKRFGITPSQYRNLKKQ